MNEFKGFGKRYFEDKSLHNTQNVTVKDIDWKCYYSKSTNNEYVLWAVFGDYDKGHEGAPVCIICYKYCVRYQ